MRHHSNSKQVTNLSLLRKLGTTEEKWVRMGSTAGGFVDKMVGMPKQLARPAAILAAETQTKVSRKASKVAKDVTARLDPDRPKKN